MPNLTQFGYAPEQRAWLTAPKLSGPAAQYAIPVSTPIYYYTGQAQGRDASGNIVQMDDTAKAEFVGFQSGYGATIAANSPINPTDVLGDKKADLDRPYAFQVQIASAVAGCEGRKVYWLFNNQVAFSGGVVNYNFAGTVLFVVDSTHVVVLGPWLRGLTQGDTGGIVPITAASNTLTKWDINKLFGLTLTGTTTLALPAASSVSGGDAIGFVRLDAGAYSSVISPNGTDKINGATSYTPSTTQYAQWTLKSDGVANWYVTTPNASGTLGATTFTGAITVAGGVAITDAANNALVVGPNGATNPTLNVDGSVSSAATGLNIQGKAAGSGVFLQAISSTGGEALDLLGGASTTSTAGGAVTIAGAAGGATTGAGGAVNLTGGVGTAGNSAGGAAVIAGGAGQGSAAGGVASLTGGQGGATGAGATSSLVGGAGGATSGTGGAVLVTGGVGTAGNAGGGAATLAAGAGQGTGAGGIAGLTGGGSGAGATGNGGVSKIVGGAALSTNGSGGAAQVTGGVATGTGTGGALTLSSGASGGSSGVAGNVTLDCGSAAAGTSGTITIGGSNASSTIMTAAVTFGTSALQTAGTGGIGYGTGVGGTVSQITSRTTGVTLSKLAGAITLVSAAGSATAFTFTVTNTLVAATDTIIANIKTATDTYSVVVTTVAAGSYKLTVTDLTGTTTETPIINVVVIKGATS